MGRREKQVNNITKQSIYNSAVDYDKKMKDKLLKLNDNQLRARLCKGQRCDICKMGCQWYEEFKRRGLT